MSNGRNSFPAAVFQFGAQTVENSFTFNDFAAFDLSHADSNLLTKLGGIFPNKHFLVPQHSQALGDDVISRMVMAAFDLFGNELLLLGCERNRHGSTIV